MHFNAVQSTAMSGHDDDLPPALVAMIEARAKEAATDPERLRRREKQATALYERLLAMDQQEPGESSTGAKAGMDGNPPWRRMFTNWRREIYGQNFPQGVKKPKLDSKKYHEQLDNFVKADETAEDIQRMQAPHPRTGNRAILELEAMEMALNIYRDRRSADSQSRKRRQFLKNLTTMSREELQIEYEDWVAMWGTKTDTADRGPLYTFEEWKNEEVSDLELMNNLDSKGRMNPDQVMAIVMAERFTRNLLDEDAREDVMNANLDNRPDDDEFEQEEVVIRHIMKVKDQDIKFDKHNLKDLVVAEVTPGSAADKAGIRPGMIATQASLEEGYYVEKGEPPTEVWEPHIREDAKKVLYFQFGDTSSEYFEKTNPEQGPSFVKRIVFKFTDAGLPPPSRGSPVAAGGAAASPLRMASTPPRQKKLPVPQYTARNRLLTTGYPPGVMEERRERYKRIMERNRARRFGTPAGASSEAAAPSGETLAGSPPEFAGSFGFPATPAGGARRPVTPSSGSSASSLQDYGEPLRKRAEKRGRSPGTFTPSPPQRSVRQREVPTTPATPGSSDISLMTVSSGGSSVGRPRPVQRPGPPPSMIVISDSEDDSSGNEGLPYVKFGSTNMASFVDHC